MNDLKQLLLELDERMTKTYLQNLGGKEGLEKTENVNITGERSRVIDLQLEEQIINFFKEKEFPCRIETEERGSVSLSQEPQYLVICDPLDGTTNYSRGIPLTCYGIAIAKTNQKKKVSFEDIQAAAVRAFHTNEYFYSDLEGGSTVNKQPIQPSKETRLEKSLIAIDLDRIWGKEPTKVQAVLRVLKQSKGIRRFGANLLDMCYVGAGRIEAAIDIRDKLSVVHTPGLFIAKNSGAVISSIKEKDFNPTLDAKGKMSFILCNNEQIANTIKELLDKQMK